MMKHDKLFYKNEADEIKKRLKTKIIGKEIIYYNELESTNILAHKIANSVKQGTVIIAESQTQGRGRTGHKWISPEGGIWLSIILKPDINPSHAPRLTILAGVSVAKTIQSYGIDAKIKWPNDILINYKKVCGILTEMEAEIDVVKYCIVGIGIDANVDTELFPDEYRDSSTSLKKEFGHEIDKIEFIKRFLEQFDSDYIDFENGKFLQILDEWRRMSATIGEWVKITTHTGSIYGEVVGVNNDGTLILESEDGNLKKIVAGTLEHLKKH